MLVLNLTAESTTAMLYIVQLLAIYNAVYLIGTLSKQGRPVHVKHDA